MTIMHIAILLTVGLVFCMVVVARASFAYGRALHRKNVHVRETGMPNIEAAVFALLGLMLAFTYSGAYSRLEIRRALVAHEANAISTAFLRLDLIPESSRARIKMLFIEYVESKDTIWRHLPNMDAALKEYERSLEIQHRIWREAVEATKAPEMLSMRILLLPPINEFIDVSFERLVAMQNHAPWIIYVLIFILALACAFMVGFSQASLAYYRWLHIVIFSVLVSATFYLIIDLEYPSVGLIQLDSANEVFLGLKKDFMRTLSP